MLCNMAISQTHAGIEQYYYTGYRVSTIVPKIYYRDEKNWYGEIRYNYDALETLSLNVGKTISGENTISYAITPTLGFVAGRLNGGSLGLNTEAELGNLYFSAESQYTISGDDKNNDFLFNWSELGYQLTGGIYTGLALQLTHLYKTNNQWEPGVMAGFSFNRFTFPVYVFNPLTNKRYFVVGVNIEWGEVNSERHQLRCFSF